MGRTNNFRNIHEKSTAEDKVKFLLDHTSLWVYDYAERAIDKRLLVGIMKKEGLVAATTTARDVKLIRVLDEAYRRWESARA